ncbi:late embryogenesis abundant protein 6-like [Cornus florida]|uniref:late embryogenesis abundant protein 6-like n=1 Tax=Cornus florida TaxID=4283 RepID=UPI00289AA9DB|nr:late embryogenesis abundant protein 6-like [Cornus florida]
MQVVKDKLGEMSAMRKVKAETKAEEKEAKDLARARAEVAHEVRLAREAEAKMDLHVNKAAEVADRVRANHEGKYGSESTARGNVGSLENAYDRDPDPFGSATTTTTDASTTGSEYLTNTTGAPAPPSNKHL